MGCLRSRRLDLTIRTAAPSLLAALLLAATPGVAFAQTVTQYQYSDGGTQQEPGGPGDPAYPGLTTPAPPSAPAQSSPAAQDQYSGGAAADPAPSPVPPGPAPSPVPPANPSQVPVGPDGPAHPGPSSQPPQPFGQTLTDVSADLGGIGQGLAALNQGAAPTTAASDPYPAAVAAFSAPTTAVVGWASPGQPPVAAVDPYSAAVNAASAVGGGAPGYTTWGQPPPGVAVLGGAPQDTQAPVTVVDPYSAAVGAVSPSVPGETAQVAQYLQQLLTQRDAMLAAQQPGPTGDASLEASLQANLDRDMAGLYGTLLQAMLNPASTEYVVPGTGTTSSEMATLGTLAQQSRDACSLSAQRYGNTPDSMSDLNVLGNDQADIRAACGPSSLTSNPMFP